MAKKRSWFEEWWGLLIVIVLLIIVLGLLIWAIAGLMNAGLGLWALLFLAILVVLVIFGAIFSEGFRSFILRIFGKRR